MFGARWKVPDEVCNFEFCPMKMAVFEAGWRPVLSSWLVSLRLRCGTFGLRLWVKLENTLSVLLVELVIVWAFEMLDWFGKLVFSCSADHPVYFFLDLFCLLTYFDIAGVAENINWLWSRWHVSGCRCVLLLGSLFCCSQPMINHHFRTSSLRFDMCDVAF